MMDIDVLIQIEWCSPKLATKLDDEPEATSGDEFLRSDPSNSEMQLALLFLEQTTSNLLQSNLTLW